jgi:hypothetical protein
MTKEVFNEVDRDALNRALQLTLAEEDQSRVEQFNAMLKERGWWSTASFCASHRQSIALGLFPWQSPPCDIDEDEIGIHDFGGAKLLKRMLSHGVS